MAKQDKKKSNKLRKPGRVLKSIGLTSLAILIILALFFQAPWKVITLLLIVLAACTVLPKPYRKWFWLSVAAIVIVLIIWVFMPADNEGWRPYTFDEELAALEAKYAIPDSENAATIYNKLLEDCKDVDFYGNLPTEVRINFPIREPWLRKDNPQLAKWLKSQQTIIETLIEASKIEKCQFPIIAHTVEPGKQTNRFSPMRRWTFLLITAASNDLGESRVDEALEKYMVVLQIGKHHYQQPTGFDKLLGIAIEALTVSQFNRFVVTGDAADTHLSVIEEAMVEIKHDWSSDLPGLLDYEMLFAKNVVCGKFYDVNPNGKIRLGRYWYTALTCKEYDLFKERPAKPYYVLPYWQRINRAGTILSWFFVYYKPKKAAKIIDAVYEKNYVMADPNFDWKEQPKKVSPMFRFNFPYLIEHLAALLEPFYSIHYIYVRAISRQRASRLIIALRRYKNKNGQWPETLDQIKSSAPGEIFVDPINGGSFVYKLTEENFALYSKGKNNIDEGGRYKIVPGDECDDRPIWPQRIYKHPSPPMPPPPPPPPPSRK